MAQRLRDKVAVVTRSDSGIGQGIAIEFAKEGADIVVNYFHDQAGAERTRKEVESAGRHAIVVQADMREEEQVENLFAAVLQAFETVDILVNNAGVDSSGIEVADMPLEVWDNAMKTNVYGPFLCARRFIKRAAEPYEIGKLAVFLASEDANYFTGST